MNTEFAASASVPETDPSVLKTHLILGCRPSLVDRMYVEGMLGKCVPGAELVSYEPGELAHASDSVWVGIGNTSNPLPPGPYTLVEVSYRMADASSQLAA